MSRLPSAGSVASALVVAGVAFWAVSAGLESAHLHGAGDHAVAHRHLHAGHHHHDDLPDPPERAPDERDDRQTAVSSFASPAPLPLQPIEPAPDPSAVAGLPPVGERPSPGLESRAAGGPRAPPR